MCSLLICWTWSSIPVSFCWLWEASAGIAGQNCRHMIMASIFICSGGCTYSREPIGHITPCCFLFCCFFSNFMGLLCYCKSIVHFISIIGSVTVKSPLTTVTCHVAHNADSGGSSGWWFIYFCKYFFNLRILAALQKQLLDTYFEH